MSLLQIKRGEGGTLEISISDTAALCSRTECCVWKEMWAVGSDGGCAVVVCDLEKERMNVVGAIRNVYVCVPMQTCAQHL